MNHSLAFEKPVIYHRVFLMKLKFINELSLCGCCNNHKLISQHYKITPLCSQQRLA